MNHQTERGTGPSDAQLLDYLRRGAVHTSDGTVIGWITPGPPADAGLHPLPEYEPTTEPHIDTEPCDQPKPLDVPLALNERGALVCVLCGHAAAEPEDRYGTPWDFVRANAVEHYRKEHEHK